MDNEQLTVPLGSAPEVAGSHDRYFVTSNGVITGPFNVATLPARSDTRNAWCWRQGENAWQPYWTDSATAVEPDSSLPDQIDELMSSLRRRGKAVRDAARLEVQTLQAKRDRAAAEQMLVESHRDHGRLAIEQAMTFGQDGLNGLCAEGRRCQQAILDLDKQHDDEEAELDHLEPKSPAADRIRGRMAELTERRRDAAAELRECQRRLGEQIQLVAPDDDRFTELRAARDQAVQDRQAANARLEQIAGQLQLANQQIGTSFRTVALVAAAVLAIAFAVTLFHWRSGRGTPVATTVTGGSIGQNLASAATPVGLARADLRLTSPVVTVSWLAYPHIGGECSGSAACLSLKPDGTMTLMTNRHVLDLLRVAQADAGSGVFVSQYSVQVKFPGGKICPVQRILPEKSGVDLAMLELDARSLTAGTDYVLVQTLPGGANPQQGDEVVAIGNPGGAQGRILENTQTFGHVSALRDDDEDGVITHMIQTDCALNHGNSGGPLMVRQGEQYFWAGINTAVMSPEGGYQGLNFAINAQQATSLQYGQYDATAAGVVSLLNQQFQVPARVYQP